MKKILIKDQKCPVTRTLSLIGERWTVLILRDFFLHGPQKYQELLESLEGISPNLLSDRLKKLSQYDIIKKELYTEHPPRYRYSLTSKGESLGPILESLRDWGREYTKFK